MLEAWLNFAIIIFVQLLLFVIYAYYVKRISDIPRILGWGVLIGIAVGLLFDLVLGKFLGLYSYALGFGSFFLTLNGALSYGIFAANTLLLQHARFSHFYIWLIVVIAVYEITNLFFRVWTYEFVLPHIAFLAMLLVGYSAGAILAAVIWHTFLGERFFFIVNKTS